MSLLLLNLEKAERRNIDSSYNRFLVSAEILFSLIGDTTFATKHHSSYFEHNDCIFVKNIFGRIRRDTLLLEGVSDKNFNENPALHPSLRSSHAV